MKLALFLLFFTVFEALTAQACTDDLFESFFSAPAQADTLYANTLASIQALGDDPPGKDSWLARKILELPDAPVGSAAMRSLNLMLDFVRRWRTRYQWGEPHAIELLLNIRKLVSQKSVQGIDDDTVFFSLAGVGLDTIASYSEEQATIWRTRLEKAFTRDAESREWRKEEFWELRPQLVFGDTFPQDIFRDSGPQFRRAGPLLYFDSGKRDSEGSAMRSLATQILRNLVLNPEAKSHRAALFAVLDAAREYRHMHRYIREIDAIPLPLQCALTDYLDPHHFPAEKKNPEVERQIRFLLRHLKIPDDKAEPRETLFRKGRPVR